MVPGSYIIYESEEGMMKMNEILSQSSIIHLNCDKFFTDEMVEDFSKAMQSVNPTQTISKI